MNDEKYREDEARKRLGKILRGAFSGPPTPLKEIPKQKAKRAVKVSSRASAASGKNVAPKP
jgi:hypothetical protein